MNDVLKTICAKRLDRVAAQQQQVPLDDLKASAADAPPVRGFRQRLEAVCAADGVALITEIKQASPSGGMIRETFDPVAHARDYQTGGAACLSVLTEPDWFKGETGHLQQARAACDLPVLRKDFILTPYQVYETRAMGADAILLILAALTVTEAHELENLALSLGLDVLIETHDVAEMQRTQAMQSRLIGVNNRNLGTLDVSLTTAHELAAQAPDNAVLVGESGYKSHADLIAATRRGINCFLIGEHLMRQPDLVQAVKTVRGR